LKQLDLIEMLDELDNRELGDTSSWSYGVVELDNGDLILAEVFWDADERPLAFSEANLVVDPEEGVQGLIESLALALADLRADPFPIRMSEFHTKGD
jgi:hypothetical protein